MTNAYSSGCNVLPTEHQRQFAQSWFENLCQSLCDRLEALERKADPALYGAPPDMPHRFDRTPWTREKGEGGGIMGMMRGRVFEKAGIHVSTVMGHLSDEFRSQVPGTGDDPRFWAAGVSFIAHPRNPHIPAAHMNTRLIVTSKSWFGGGGDLTPMLQRYRCEDAPQTVQFHTAFQKMCAQHHPEYYARYKSWCDDYFYLPHRAEARGVGGIFFDRHNTGNWSTDFSFTQDVGQCFLDIYPILVTDHMHIPWSDEDREEQMFQRGRYAEYNLLYDRGTTFGLKTGGNVEAILSSLPPLAKWP